jgi:hypothetical protein
MRIPTPLSPVTAAEVPLHFMADYCLRCCTMFRDGQVCCVVTGGPAAKYRRVGLIIDQECLQDATLDRQRFLSTYRHPNATALRTGYWPRYYGNPTTLQGYGKVSMLDNGLARVGLHRGHVEVWQRHEVRAWHGRLGSYAEDYAVFSISPGLYHSVVDVRFYDLSKPFPPGRAPGAEENCYVRGGTVAHLAERGD